SRQSSRNRDVTGWQARGPRKRPSSFCSLAEEALLDRVANELGTAREPQLLHDVAAVGLGRADRDVELVRDLLVRVAEREQAENLALAVGERILLGLAGRVGLGCDQARAELRVHVAS